MAVYSNKIGTSHYLLYGGVGKKLGGSDVQNRILWGGQKFEIGLCGGVRSSKLKKMGGSNVVVFHISLGGSNVSTFVEILQKCVFLATWKLIYHNLILYEYQLSFQSYNITQLNFFLVEQPLFGRPFSVSKTSLWWGGRKFVISLFLQVGGSDV